MSTKQDETIQRMQSIIAAIESNDVATMRAEFQKQTNMPVGEVDILKFALGNMYKVLLEELNQQ